MTPLVEQILWLAFFAACVFGSASCSGIETGLYSLNRIRLDLRAKRVPADGPAKTIQSELAVAPRAIATLLIGNNIFQFFGAVAITSFFESAAFSEQKVFVLSNILIAPILFVLAEAFPKELFRVEADRLTYTYAYPLSTGRRLLTWTGILPLIRGVRTAVERAFRLDSDDFVEPRQRIAQLLKEGAGHGVLSESQVSLLDRAMLLRGVTVADEMVPWSRVRAVPVEAGRAALRRIIGRSVHARLPVVDKTGRVVGVLRQIDLHLDPHATPASLILPPVRFQRGTRVREALVQIRDSESKLGIVEDGRGVPLGIVTAKDLVEPLTGELADL